MLIMGADDGQDRNKGDLTPRFVTASMLAQEGVIRTRKAGKPSLIAMTKQPQDARMAYAFTWRVVGVPSAISDGKVGNPPLIAP